MSSERHTVDDDFLIATVCNIIVVAHDGAAGHIVLHPYTRFEVRWSPLRKMWRIFRLSINRPRDLDL